MHGSAPAYSVRFRRWKQSTACRQWQRSGSVRPPLQLFENTWARGTPIEQTLRPFSGNLLIQDQRVGERTHRLTGVFQRNRSRPPLGSGSAAGGLGDFQNANSRSIGCEENRSGRSILEHSDVEIGKVAQ